MRDENALNFFASAMSLLMEVRTVMEASLSSSMVGLSHSAASLSSTMLLANLSEGGSFSRGESVLEMVLFVREDSGVGGSCEKITDGCETVATG